MGTSFVAADKANEIKSSLTVQFVCIIIAALPLSVPPSSISSVLSPPFTVLPLHAVHLGYHRCRDVYVGDVAVPVLQQLEPKTYRGGGRETT
jgi:hypothetical protein